MSCTSKLDEDKEKYNRCSDFKFVGERISGKKKFRIDYYQREYKWGKEQIVELINDLVRTFSLNSQRNYYLGTFIARHIADDECAIVDGQQRLTSITLLLIYILNKTDNEEIRESLNLDNGTNWEFGNCDDEERKTVLRDLANHVLKDYSNASAKIMSARYHDIEEIDDDDIKKIFGDVSQIDEFGKWILNHVFFLRIEVEKQSDAYNLFVGRNDRGLPLSEIDLVKSYLLSNVNDSSHRDFLDESWKKTFNDLKNSINSESEERFFVDFLRARYACSIRKPEKNAADVDYEKIGNSLHKWVTEKISSFPDLQGSSTEDKISDFISSKTDFYAKQYIEINKYKTESNPKFFPKFESVFYNNFIRMDYQTMVLRAALNPDDKDNEIEKKIKIVSYFLDCFSASRIVNSKEFNWNSNKLFLFSFLQDIRNKKPRELCDYCKAKIQAFPYSISNIYSFSLNDHNGNKVKYILSRLTSFISEKINKGNQFPLYINTDKKQGTIFDVEHVLARNRWKTIDSLSESDKSAYGFSDKDDFNRYVNRIGNLILLDTKKNKSLSDKPAEEKIPHYQGDNNPLRSSLCDTFYVNNPDFKEITKTYGFEPVTTIMSKQAIEKQCTIYQKIAESIWNPERLEKIYLEK